MFEVSRWVGRGSGDRVHAPFGGSPANVASARAICLDVCQPSRKLFFVGFLFAHADSLGDIVQICNGNVGNELRGQKAGAFEVIGWWVAISVSRNCLMCDRFLARFGT